MNKYYIMIILLKECYYSTSAYNLLISNNIPCQFIHIDVNDADKYKTKFISTFPQIYLKNREKKGSLLLGGYNDLNIFIQNFKNQKLDNTKINLFREKYKWSKKATLRLIQLINLK